MCTHGTAQRQCRKRTQLFCDLRVRFEYAYLSRFPYTVSKNERCQRK